MGYRPIQSAFNAGALRSSYRGRVGSPLYVAGMESCINWQPKVQGAVRTRPGTKRVATMPAGTGRIIGTRTSDGRNFVIALGDDGSNKKLYILDEAGFVEITQNLLANGTFTAGFTGWTEVDSGSQNYGLTDIAAGRAVLQGYSDYTGNFEHGSFYQDEAISSTGTYTVRFDLDIPSYSDRLGRVRVVVTDGATTRIDETFSGPINETIVRTCTLTNGQTARVRFYDATLFAQLGQHMTGGYIDNVVLVGAVAIPYITHPWAADQFSAVQYAEFPAENTVIFVHPNVAPWELTYDPTTGAWSSGNITFTDAPAEWTGTNWPRTVEVDGNRLWFGGTPAKPGRIFASKVGELYTFTAGTVASSPITINLSSKGAIRWLSGQNGVMLVGTDLEVVAISGSNGYPAYGDFHARRQTALGSRQIQAVWSGDGTMYTGTDGRSLRIIQFDDGAQQWRMPDLAAHGDCLASPVKEMVFLSSPEESLVALLEDGSLDVATFSRGDGMAAWWTLNVAGGTVASAAGARTLTGDILWLLVDRPVGRVLESLRLADSRVRLDGAVEGTTSAVTDSEFLLITDGGATQSRKYLGSAENAQFVASDGTNILIGLEGELLYSDDGGESWTDVAPDAAATYRAGIWSADAALWMVVTTGGKLYSASAGPSAGGDWTAVLTPADTNFRAVVYAESTGIVAGQDTALGQAVIYNSSIPAWQKITDAAVVADAFIYCLAHGNGTFLAGGALGIYYSPTALDGSWAAAAGSPAAVRSICWSATYSKFFAVTSAGTIHSSADGITWATLTAPAGTLGLYGVAEVGSSIIAVGDTGTLVYSLDGTSWTRVDVGDESFNGSIGVIGTTAIAAGNAISKVVLGGAASLSGLDVSVLANATGAVESSSALNSHIVLEGIAAGTDVTAGVEVQAEFTTLRRNGGVPGGTGLGGKHRDSQIGVMLLGRTVELNGSQARKRNTAAATATTDYDDILWATSAGWDEDGRITVTSMIPAITEVLALVANTDSHGG